MLTALLSHLDVIPRWLEDLGPAIDAKVDEMLGRPGEAANKELVTIDVSRLADERQIEVSYAHDGWGDMGIAISITDGRVTGAEAGD